MWYQPGYLSRKTLRMYLRRPRQGKCRARDFASGGTVRSGRRGRRDGEAHARQCESLHGILQETLVPDVRKERNMCRDDLRSSYTGTQFTLIARKTVTISLITHRLFASPLLVRGQVLKRFVEINCATTAVRIRPKFSRWNKLNESLAIRLN